MKNRYHRQRGAALLETALVLPILLGALYAIVWGIRVGVVTERSEQVVRYAGVLEQQQNPYLDYSLYTLYNNLNGQSNVPTQPCAVPNSNFVKGGTVATVPGVASSTTLFGSFFLPNSLTVDCTTPARVNLTNGYLRQYLMLTQSPVVTADINADFAGVLPGAAALGTHTLARRMPFYRSPDLSSLLHCSPQLSAVITASLDPTTDGSQAGVTLPLAAADGVPLAFTSNCNSGSGAPVPVPSQPAFVPTPVPSPSAIATGRVPTPTPSTSPSATPTVKPTAAPTPVPTASGSGGTGGGGGTSPTSAPTVAPTAKPTTVPTATPTAKPTAAPTPKPTATPTPQPPSGPVS